MGFLMGEPRNGVWVVGTGGVSVTTDGQHRGPILDSRNVELALFDGSDRIGILVGRLDARHAEWRVGIDAARVVFPLEVHWGFFATMVHGDGGRLFRIAKVWLLKLWWLKLWSCDLKL